MFLLFGTRANASVLAIVQFACRLCGVSAPQRVVRRQNRFTLFFVPLFAFSTSYQNECSHCGAVTPLTKMQVENAQKWSVGQSTTV